MHFKEIIVVLVRNYKYRKICIIFWIIVIIINKINNLLKI